MTTMKKSIPTILLIILLMVVVENKFDKVENVSWQNC